MNNICAIPRIWDGETAYIIGGGPSVRDMPLSLFQGKNIIAVNNSWEILRNSSVLYFSDHQWWTWNKEKVLNGFNGEIITDCSHKCFENEECVRRVFRQNRHGLEWRDSASLAWNRSGGANAINVAVHMGATRIVLVGFDMRIVDGAPHGGNNWHDDHKFMPRDNCYQKFLRFFPFINEDLAKMNAETGRDVRIFNATPGSALTLYPFVTLEKTLAPDFSGPK